MSKEPVLLVVLVEAEALRWLTAAIDRQGQVFPLLRSEDGDLRSYLDMEFDEQVSFLRHRFCGVLQRGADRVWKLNRKPSRFVFIFDRLLDGQAEELTLRVSEHFVEWMTSPPVVVFLSERGFDEGPSPLALLAGGAADEDLQTLETAMEKLYAAVAEPSAWATVPQKDGA